MSIRPSEKPGKDAPQPKCAPVGDGHAFISYLHDDTAVVERLVRELHRAGVGTWLDRDALHAGSRWAQAIERAIEAGSFFIACFSLAYLRREQTYMHEELAVACRLLRERPDGRDWLIPVLIDGCSAKEAGLESDPDLAPLHAVALHPDWPEGIRKLLRVLSPARAFGRCLNELPEAEHSESGAAAPLLAMDFGTSNSLLAQCTEAGDWVPIRDADGRAFHPSVVTFDQNWNYWVGREAIDAAARKPARSVQNIKRLLLRNEDVVLEHKRFSPVVLASLVIRHMAACAEAQLGAPVTRILASAPANFGWLHKEALVRACTLAGLEVEGLILEPNATGSAAIAWVEERPDLVALAENEFGGVLVLVVDVGGGTTDVSLEIIGRGQHVWDVETVAAVGDNALGGMDYDAAIHRWLHERLIEPRGKGLRWTQADDHRLLMQARQLKEALASSDRASVTVTDVENEHGQLETLALTVDRAALAPALRALDDRVGTLIDAIVELGFLRWGREEPPTIRYVLLGGQGSKVWSIADLLQRQFEGAERIAEFQENAVSLGLVRNARRSDLLLMWTLTKSIGVRSLRVPADEWESSYAGVPPDWYRSPVDDRVRLLLGANARCPTWIEHEFRAGPGDLVLEVVEIERDGRLGDVLGTLQATLTVRARLTIRVEVVRGDNRVFELRSPEGTDRLALNFSSRRAP